MKRKIYILLAITFLLACKSKKVLTTASGIKIEQQYLVKYFENNLDQEDLKNPDSNYYHTYLPVDSVSKTASKLWSIWKDANLGRSKNFPTNFADTTNVVWNIPANQQMKIQFSKKGVRPTDGYPFFINLHGGGSYKEAKSAWGFEGNNREWTAAKRLGAAYKDAPSLYFVPRMADDRIGRWYYRPQQATWLRAWQLAVLSDEVNADKTYILGISEGGYGSFRMGTFYADYFAGLGPMAGPETVEAAPIENLRNIATRVEVGEKDTGFGRNEMGRSWLRRLDSAAKENPGQFNHVVVIQPNKGHGINYYDVAPWLVKQTRKNYPDTLSFTFYECDGGYRKGFGHVRLDGLSKTGEKDFKIIKKGNVFAITTKDRKNTVTGSIELYLEKIDYKKRVTVTLNGVTVAQAYVKPNLGVMAESLALFGDPKRIFASKVRIEI